MKSLNQEILGALIELDADTGGTLLLELIDVYKKEMPLRLKKLKSAIEQKDPTKTVFEAHGTKSSFANFGGTNVAQLLFKVETDAKSESWNSVTEAMSHLPAAMEEFEADLEELKKKIESRSDGKTS